MRMQNLGFVCTYTFRMKSTESFINEAPDLCVVCVLQRWLNAHIQPLSLEKALDTAPLQKHNHTMLTRST